MAIFLRKNKEAREIFARVIKKGGIVLHPTDTVYGLAADAFNTGALKKLAFLKGRTSLKPFLVLATEDMLPSLASYIPFYLKKKWRDFLEKPLTAVLYAKVKRPFITSKGKIAIRIPSDEFLLDVIKIAGRPIASTSANPSGTVLPQEKLISFFSWKVDLIISGQSGGKKPSTIVDFTSTPPVVLRKGEYKFI
ncbi:MAG: threonylcarbamoyl-AMP synthase [Candidatus Aminicenantes bacterium]|nr:threonylcarbamoyl-AMP synthase [Candidatus Aminicenantes bacterium]